MHFLGIYKRFQNQTQTRCLWESRSAFKGLLEFTLLLRICHTVLFGTKNTKNLSLELLLKLSRRFLCRNTVNRNQKLSLYMNMSNSSSTNQTSMSKQTANHLPNSRETQSAGGNRLLSGQTRFCCSTSQALNSTARDPAADSVDTVVAHTADRRW